MTSSDYVEIDYTNWRGERAKRIIRPLQIWFGSTEWHPEPQWFLSAFDLAKANSRDFAMKDIHGWEGAANDR